jgi:hypothetical protein
MKLVTQKERDNVYTKYGVEKREWLLELYQRSPILYLDKAKQLFDRQFSARISKSYISIILRESGLSYKMIQRRAIQITTFDVLRFSQELQEHAWLIHNLVFIDEVSFDNREMYRKRGFGLKGQTVVFRGEYCRKPRVSLLCLLGVTGILDIFSTEGTFDRNLFIDSLREFALKNDQASTFPGPNSLWIMDGAKIHCHENVVHYLRSIGIIVLFLPAYCPFFNPIELVFGYVKPKLRRYLVEGSRK